MIKIFKLITGLVNNEPRCLFIAIFLDKMKKEK